MNNMQPMGNMSLQTPDERQMGLFLHLSQLINFIIPLGGVVAPIILWQTQKDKMPALDAHGKMVVNWLISSLIYWVVSGVLAIVLIGFLGMLALAIMGIAFPIMGGIKANNGEFWEYPLTIKFIK
ncbi:DUF4870 domain-containing protein [soil metagenome]